MKMSTTHRGVAEGKHQSRQRKAALRRHPSSKRRRERPAAKDKSLHHWLALEPTLKKKKTKKTKKTKRERERKVVDRGRKNK
jgi:hypothetical protein